MFFINNVLPSTRLNVRVSPEGFDGQVALDPFEERLNH